MATQSHERPSSTRHAVVTGASGGIGAAIARRLDRMGMRLTLMDVRPEPIEAAAANLTVARAVPVDLTDEKSVARAFDDAVEGFGAVDVLVNGAGVALTAPFERTELAQWQLTLAVNLTGTFLCTRAVLDGMRARGWGRIVNIASTAALKGYAYVSAYCASKHGVLGITRALALETARPGITVNAICPGYTDTPLVARAVENIVAKTGRTREQALAELIKVNPQHRLIRPSEVADAVVWLCGEGTESVTGQAIAVAGGEVM